MGKGGVSKRSKYRTEEEKVAKEKDRRNANNQRERSAKCTSCVSMVTIYGITNLDFVAMAMQRDTMSMSTVSSHSLDDCFPSQNPCS